MLSAISNHGDPYLDGGDVVFQTESLYQCEVDIQSDVLGLVDWQDAHHHTVRVPANIHHYKINISVSIFTIPICIVLSAIIMISMLVVMQILSFIWFGHQTAMSHVSLYSLGGSVY